MATERTVRCYISVLSPGPIAGKQRELAGIAAVTVAILLAGLIVHGRGGL